MMPLITESSHIPGVFVVELRSFADARGRFVEIFRKEWFPQRSWDIVQSNRSESNAGVLRGLHYHHRQVDYWHVVQGRIQAAVVDLRRSSKTFGASQLIHMDDEAMLGLFIPKGVAHGFLSLSDATLLYIVDNYYDGADEYGVAWNDPEIGLAWSVDHPVLSSRDMNNPFLHEIPQSELPG